MSARTGKPGTYSIRVAACRYAAVLELEKAGLCGAGAVTRAYADLERAAVQHAAEVNREIRKDAARRGVK